MASDVGGAPGSVLKKKHSREIGYAENTNAIAERTQ
jgi:hypothetical protein